MFHGKKIVCVIPARLYSTRFPKKLLADLLGKPLIQWTWEAACRIDFFDEIIIAVDDEEMARSVKAFGGHFCKTSPQCLNGTQRLIEVYQKEGIQGDVWVNWQGDEPFLSKRMIQDLLQTCAAPGIDLWTLKSRLEDERSIEDKNICKVVCAQDGKALFFSRSPIPHLRDQDGKREVFKHIGLYAYTGCALEKIATLPPCMLEQAEMLEQLRFLFHGMSIQVHETKEDSIGIDLKEHLVAAEAFLKRL